MRVSKKELCSNEIVANGARSKCGNEPSLDLFKPTEHIPENFDSCEQGSETGLKNVDDGASDTCALVVRRVTCD